MSEPKPTAAEVSAWLTKTYPLVENATSWATYLEGLQWGYIRPVCQIAVNAHHDHPAIALSTAAAASEDLVFKLTVRNHIEAKSAVP